MSPMERLLAEAIPTGRFGDATPVRPRTRSTEAPSWTAEEQAQHYAELEAAIRGHDRRAASRPERHLRVVEAA
ncbi:hypothetical protein ACIOEX_01315 [Streptomyces sp. NPDC087850]|uniref:hypothetical protein n=1 Tax=Streptomyces sp. NPDC087850 TaxID=3365809 RepID=UPI0038076510